jgi:D-alanine-D-alanine ligase
MLKKKLAVLALFDATKPTTPDQDLTTELATPDWTTEANVLEALQSLGWTVEHQAIFDDTQVLRAKIDRFQPDLVFNLADQFRNNRGFDQNIVSLLELIGIPFTGCGSTGLLLSKHKGISKKILGYHRIRVPAFTVIPRTRRIQRPRRLRFPILVKPLKEQGSLGIAQASFVEDDHQFRDRVAFVHEKYDHDAIAEEYIEGRELYLSILGNVRLQVFPIREMVFQQVAPDDPRIATYNAKWDEQYRQRWGICNQFADQLEPALVHRITQLGRRIYRLLGIDGYARLDLRLTPTNEIVFIEANPNPALARDEDFAQSALAAKFDYPQLIRRIALLGLTTPRD